MKDNRRHKDMMPLPIPYVFGLKIMRWG